MKKWAVNKPDRKIVSEIALKCGVSTITAAVLASKGFQSAQAVVDSLEVNELSDPFLIKDMREAADTINDAIDSGCKICIYGDYDCDGIMSTVMLYSYLLETGADVIYYIPERSEGYGLNRNAIEYLAEINVGLIVTVDNGISAVEESEIIYQNDMRLVITDHHQPCDTFPRAEAIVDPHRTDCFSPFKPLCGAGVALKLIAALDGGDYTMALEQFGDLAAIATVADIVSLTGENRFIASYGMQLIENTDRPALESLKKVCKLSDKPIDSFSIGFGIAPRINASGRFGSPSKAVELFLCEDSEETDVLATELNELNTQRKNTEAEIMNDIYAMIDADPMLIRQRVLFLCGKNWHHGVIGIIASKITEQFGKPAFIASEADGEVRGSARSFGEFSVHSALKHCSPSLEKFGGHPGAGGFTIKPDQTEEFNRLLQNYALENHKNMPIMTLTADTPLSPAEISIPNIKSIKLLEPFGADNEKPLFFIENASVLEIIPLSNGAHTKLKLKFGFTEIETLIFRTSPAELSIAKGDVCDMIVSLDINVFRGNESVSIIVSDYRSHSTEQSKIFAAHSAYESFMRHEELPANYYRSMYPIRDEAVAIYIKIPAEGINLDTLFCQLNQPQINFCKFCVTVEALLQLKLISYNSSTNKIFRLKAEKKVDLMSAPVLVELNNKIR